MQLPMDLVPTAEAMGQRMQEQAKAQQQAEQAQLQMQMQLQAAKEQGIAQRESQGQEAELTADIVKSAVAVRLAPPKAPGA
jgi:hypothetical protein